MRSNTRRPARHSIVYMLALAKESMTCTLLLLTQILLVLETKLQVLTAPGAFMFANAFFSWVRYFILAFSFC